MMPPPREHVNALLLTALGMTIAGAGAFLTVERAILALADRRRP
jgi:hypothetical protein